MNDIYIDWIEAGAPAPGGGVGPPARFGGGSPSPNYIQTLGGGPTGFANTTGLTFAIRFRPLGVPTRLAVLCGGAFYSIGFGGGGAATVRPLFANFGGAFVETAAVSGADQWVSLMLSVDRTGTLLGGVNTLAIRANGAAAIYDANATGPAIQFNEASDQPFKIFNDGGAGAISTTLDTDGVIVWPHALDPATYWDDIFNGSNELQSSIFAAPTLDGVDPVFIQTGAFGVWNSESDVDANPYDIVGAAIAVP